MRYARLYEFENFALLLNKIDNFSYYLDSAPNKKPPFDFPKEQNLPIKVLYDNNKNNFFV